MEKIDFSQALKALNGEDMKMMNPDGSVGGVLKLSEVCSNALLSGYEDEKNLSAEEKVKRFKLAHKVFEAGEIELASEEATLIRKVVNKKYPTMIVGQVYEVIK